MKVPDGESKKAKKGKRLKRRNMKSELTLNIQSNYKFWVAKIKQEQKEKKVMYQNPVCNPHPIPSHPFF